MRWYWAAAIGVAAAAGTAWLTRRRSRGIQVAASALALAAPVGVNAIVNAARSSSSCVLLFASDTHGAAEDNQRLAAMMAAEPGVGAVLLGGDEADAPGLWPVWWDRVFDQALAPTPIYSASGNHDVDGEEQEAEFRQRFGQLPRTVRCGSVDVFLLPWNVGASTAAWLRENVQTSSARWRVVVVHQPLWSASEGLWEGRYTRTVRELLLPSLSKVHLVLAGHDHVYWDSTHQVPGGTVRQVVVVSGPKAYECDPRAVGCVADRRLYLRIEANQNELRVVPRWVE